MSIVASLIYWVIVALWLAVFCTVCVAYYKNPRTFGTTRLLLAVVVIDTVRNIAENVYFGLYFGSLYGIFPKPIGAVLGAPYLLIIPKLLNVTAACVVLLILFMRWLPMAARDRARAEREAEGMSAALRQEIEEQRQLFETSGDLIMVADRNRVIRRISRSCKAILGYEPEEVIGTASEDYVDVQASHDLRLAFGRTLDGEAQSDRKTGFVHKDGHVVPLSLTMVWLPEAQRMFITGRDMTERLAVKRRLEQLAHFDQLTGLPNRVSLTRDIEALMRAEPAETEGRNAAFSIAAFDLDRFKNINDTLGRTIGDLVVKEVAARLNSTVGEGAAFYRVGGDEFLLLMPSCASLATATRVVEGVLEGLEKPFLIEGHRLFVGASAGIAVAPCDGTTPAELTMNADLALHDAKSFGGRRHSHFQPAMRAKALAMQEMETKLRSACSAGEFALFYQPQIRLGDGAVVGAEALLRWRHPQLGLLSPATFIDTLAQSPAALEVSTWILRTACEQVAQWRTKGLPPLRVGINLFPAQLQYGLLLKDIDACLAACGLPAEALELEITENIALVNEADLFAAMRQRGIGLALDDFGTGYASLSYLMRYPLTRLKIDKSFVQKITPSSSAEDTAIVRSIIGMAHNLGLEVVAEGVETETQAAFLAQRGCEEAQGHLFAHPMPPEEFQAYLRKASQRPGFRANMNVRELGKVGS